MISMFFHTVLVILTTLTMLVCFLGYLLIMQLRSKPQTAFYWLTVLRRLFGGY